MASNWIHSVRSSNKSTLKLGAKDVLPNKPHAGRQKGRKMSFFLITLTFDLYLQTRLSEGPNTFPCEFGANPFSGS